jgi:hypothetical protein
MYIPRATRKFGHGHSSASCLKFLIDHLPREITMARGPGLLHLQRVLRHVGFLESD